MQQKCNESKTICCINAMHKSMINGKPQSYTYKYNKMSNIKLFLFLQSKICCLAVVKFKIIQMSDKGKFLSLILSQYFDHFKTGRKIYLMKCCLEQNTLLLISINHETLGSLLYYQVISLSNSYFDLSFYFSFIYSMNFVFFV